MQHKKVLLIGWDAADWKVIHPLMEQGKMPGMKTLVEHGTMSEMMTLHPILSPMLWTSIATGKHCFNHGIYGFSEPTPDKKTIRPITNLSRKTKAIWNILNQKGYKSNVIGWWPSHPAEPINGVMVSNQFHHSPRQPDQIWPLLPETIHPARLNDALMDLRVYPQELVADVLEPFIPLLLDIDLEKDKRPIGVARVLSEASTIQATATHLIQNEPWDFMAVYFDAIDHFSHGFMKYHPPRQDWIPEKDFELYNNVVTMGYIYHDIMLQNLLNLVDLRETVVIIVSDHGFHPDHLRPKAIPKEPAGPAAEHRDHGIFLATGPGIKQDHLIHGTRLLDVTPTILSLFGLPIGEDMDGDVLLDIYKEPPEITSIPSWDEVEGDAGQHAPEKALSDNESQEAIEQLVALGYIDKPDSDQSKAVSETQRELDYNLGQAYLDCGQVGNAVGIFEKLWQEWPMEHRFGIRLAYCYQLLGQTQVQRQVVEAMLKRRREESQAAKIELQDFHKVLQERKQDKEKIEEAALKEVEEAVMRDKLDQTEPEDKEPLMSQMERQQYLNLRSQAQFDPFFMHYLLGDILFNEGKYEEALTTLEKAEKINPKAVNLHNLLGQVYLEMHSLPKARASFKTVISYDPHNADAYLGLARIALAQTKYRKASNLAHKALGLQFHFPIAHYYLGLIQEKLGQLQKAEESFQTALYQNPNLLKAHHSLEQLYAHKLHKPKEAQVHTDAIAEIGKIIKQHKARKAIEITEINGGNEVQKVKLEPSDKPTEKPCDIIIVSGLPRSGTSMMMQMLEAGGVPILTDGKREADSNNLKGYYEYEKTKHLQTDRGWLPEADGKAVKIIAQLLPFLPPRTHKFKVIFMQRNLDEVLASQEVMLKNLNRPGAKLPPDKLKASFAAQIRQIKQVLGRTIETHYVDYHQAIKDPQKIAKQIQEFLDQDLDVNAMAKAVEPKLRRQM
ncbi:alkaline phosphatase family protein [Candidatus Halobeggiatoa sp. HSG11]|nr:alkaline phosphatase family protein [Candidatus Halobeggiatoa sp. HSG11]